MYTGNISFQKLHNTFLVLIMILSTMSAVAQSANYRAQGYYYKAKELFEAGNNGSAIQYVLKSKDALGGSNEKLQYLHIMICVSQKDWINANDELSMFFDLTENKVSQVYFTKTVETLTNDEVKALTKVMVDIEENAAYESSMASRKETKDEKIIRLLDGICDTYYTYVDGADKETITYDRIGTEITVKRKIESYSSCTMETTKFSIHDMTGIVFQSALRGCSCIWLGLKKEIDYSKEECNEYQKGIELNNDPQSVSIARNRSVTQGMIDDLNSLLKSR